LYGIYGRAPTGCTWDPSPGRSSCTGEPHPCDYYNNADDCVNLKGCNWIESDNTWRCDFNTADISELFCWDKYFRLGDEDQSYYTITFRHCSLSGGFEACSSCSIYDVRGFTYFNDVDWANEEKCLSCTICDSSVAYDCSNVSQDRCAIRNCDGTCSSSGDPGNNGGSANDSDGDGVPDSLDLCPGTLPWDQADSFGCSPSQRGDDNTHRPTTQASIWQPTMPATLPPATSKPVTSRPSAMPPTASPTTTRPTTTAPTLAGFDPERDDPNWPGQSPKPGTSHRLIINIQYDDYPYEVDWTFEQRLDNSTSVNGTGSNASSILNPLNGNQVGKSLANTSWLAPNSTTAANDEDLWLTIDRFDPEDFVAAISFFQSYTQAGLLNDTLYRFVIRDKKGDGICCDYGQGWVAITDSTGVLWSLHGRDVMSEATLVYFWVDGNGTVEILEDLGSTEEKSILLNNLPDFTLLALEDPSTPQYLALEWLNRHPQLEFMPAGRLRQLMALGTHYYATGGESSWEAGANTDWLNASINECQWRGARYFDPDCNSDGEYQNLFMRSAGLAGKISPEISLLSSLTSLYLALNDLTGVIPTELGLMSALKRLTLETNSLVGTIPTELGQLTNLISLELDSNLLSGPIPKELGALNALTGLELHNNGLTGTTPSALCDLHIGIYIDCDKVDCTCPLDLISCSCL
jgi:hypothetical protein